MLLCSPSAVCYAGENHPDRSKHVAEERDKRAESKQASKLALHYSNNRCPNSSNMFVKKSALLSERLVQCNQQATEERPKFEQITFVSNAATLHRLNLFFVRAQYG